MNSIPSPVSPFVSMLAKVIDSRESLTVTWHDAELLIRKIKIDISDNIYELRKSEESKLAFSIK
jgi:hypothetical protein